MAGGIGLFAGPVLAGFFLERYGRVGFIALPIMALVALVSGWRWVRDHASENGSQEAEVSLKTEAEREKDPKSWQRGVLIVIIILAAYTTSITMFTFLPKLFTELNYRQDVVGLLSGMYLLGGPFGGVLGGYLGDKYASKYVIGYSLLGAVIPLYLALTFTGFPQAFWLLVAGFFSGMPHALLVLMAQSFFPQKKGMASGLVLGFMFFSGSLGSAILGGVADNVGLQTMLSNLGLLALVAAIAAFLLPKANSEE